MVKASKGMRCRTRGIFRKNVREKGMPPITRFFQKFEIGDKVAININSSIHKGAPHSRFHGLTGTVRGTQGDAYIIDVREGHKIKHILATSVHLKKV